MKLADKMYTLVLVLWIAYVIAWQSGWMPHASKGLHILISVLVVLNVVLHEYGEARNSEEHGAKTFHVVMVVLMVLLGVGLVVTSILGI